MKLRRISVAPTGDLIKRPGSLPLGYAEIAIGALRDLEDSLRGRYGDNWRLRMERESPGVWRCHWDVLTASGEVLGGGSESFSITISDWL